jgi:hypothetical protein
VGEGGDEVSVARFIADQRTKHRVPHALSCRLLGVSESWFYKWHQRPPTDRQIRRGEVDVEVRRLFELSGRTYGSPRIHTDLLEAGWTINAKTVAESMQRQGLMGRKPKRRKGLTKQDKTVPKFPDLLRRDFTAAAPNLKWCGDVTEIPTDEGKLYLASVIDLFSRKLLACPTSIHPNTELCADAIKIAVATRGGRQAVEGVIFHTDRGSTYTSGDFTKLCKQKLGVRQSMGRHGSGRASTTPPRSRSSPPSNTKSCPGTTSRPAKKHVGSCSPGATSSTTSPGDTARLRCCHRTTLRPPLSNRKRHNRSLHDFRGNPEAADAAGCR